jgi:L-alanine-DL-glutamate epimerase-like enolase superfamily enzyme
MNIAFQFPNCVISMGIGHEAGFSEVPDARFIRYMADAFMSGMSWADNTAAKTNMDATLQGIIALIEKTARKTRVAQMRRRTDERLASVGGDGAGALGARSWQTGGRLAAIGAAKLSICKTGAPRCATGAGAVAAVMAQCGHGACSCRWQGGSQLAGQWNLASASTIAKTIVSFVRIPLATGYHSNMDRRDFLRSAALAPAAFGICRGAAASRSVRIDEVHFSYEDFRYRTPYRFGAQTVDRVTLLNVDCAVRTGAGQVVRGFGSMTMGNAWSFPSKAMSYDTTLGAMKALAARIARITGDYREAGHPVDINCALEPEYLKAAGAVSQELKLTEPIPKLCTLVTASPFDAAIHDAYGKAFGLSSYLTYTDAFMPYDLSRYLGADYKGEYLSKYVLPKPAPRMALYHSVGASDPIVASDIRTRIGDGLPETLPEWIRYNGLRRVKIKLAGNDLAWDLARVVHIDRATTETQQERGVGEWFYSLDFNEQCPNVGYLLEFLRRLKEHTAAGFERIQYVEQPTARDLKADRANVMFEAAKLRPVVIDESLTDIESLMLAREMGYSGAALKACKGQSQVLLMAAAAQKYKMFLCVQDLTCPGASLIHSAGLAAHVPGVAAIEANAREYVPAANRPWQDRFPGIFKVRDGMMDTSGLDGPGLGAYEIKS